MKNKIKTAIASVPLVCLGMLPILQSEACTRLVYKAPENTVITARSMDWTVEIDPNLWIFPRGLERDGSAGPHSVKWKSRYGSLVTSAYDISSVDGMNEKGLVGNLLWLAESKYPDYDGKKPALSVAAWLQYVLDNYATVAEAVEALKEEPFIVRSADVPGMVNKFANLHLSLSDASGDNAIFEYVDGKLVIHHSPSYTVMTNSPTFDHQLAINEYWEGISGTVMLPGTNRAADRFVRASFYVQAIPQTSDPLIAVASVLSVIRNASVPYGISSPTEPNIASTRWRSVADQKSLVYFFETVLTPNTFWVNVKDIDFSEGQPVKMLPLTQHQVYTGNALGSFKESKAFEFVGP
jgi:penicillin V acylase-like amidase (Ntn superfamily)